MATLAAALAACGGGGGGGPTPPPPPPPPPPPNNAPTATDASGTAVEDGDPATGGAVGSDEDGDALTYTVTKDGDLGSLALADDGSWTYTITDSDDIQALGVGATLTDTATIEVSDGEATASATVTITIEGANDDPTGEDGTGAITAGDAMAVMPAGNVNPMDVDKGDTHTFAVGDAPAHGTLTVDEAGGWSYALNQEDAAVMALDEGDTVDDSGTIVITDNNGGSATVTVTVTITGINDAPTAPALDETPDALTIKENDGTGSNIGTLSSSDPEGDAITYSVDNDHLEVEVVGDTAVLKYKEGASFDYEATEDGMVTVMVTATDEHGVVSEATAVTVTVTDVNEAPTISIADGETPDGVMAKSMIEENTMGPVGEITAMDPEGDDLTFTVSDDRFSVDEDALGGYWLVLDEGIDNEMESEVMVTVTVSDGELSAMVEATITITDVNEAPTIMVQDGAGATGSLSENATGRAYQIIVSDQEDELTAADVTIDDDRFVVETDDDGGLWVSLNEAVNFEVEDADDDPTIDLVVTVTDSGELSATATATVTITDENDNPAPSMVAMDEDGNAYLLEVVRDSKGVIETSNKKVGEYQVVAGTALSKELNLNGMFDDEDGDTNFTYTLKGAPTWLKLTSSTTDGEVRWTLEGTPLESKQDLVTTVTLVATDQSGGQGEISFDIIWDDGNEAPYDLIVKDADNTETYTSDPVSENMDGAGTGLFVSVKDPDNPTHAHGMITWSVDNKKFEIAENGEIVLKAGESLDFEGDSGSVQLEITATDGGSPKLDTKQTATVVIKDENDPVMKGGTPGNWWVTVNEDLDDDTVTPGSWLKFNVEEPEDSKPLFEDEDGAADLTYSLKSGPSWLEVSKAGVIQNKKEVLPTRGEYQVTITATDKGGAKADQTFTLTVVLSGGNNEDNDEPKITNDRGMDVPEDAGKGVTVATFTVEDEDYDVPMHPYAPEMPTITQVKKVASNGGETTFDYTESDAVIEFKIEKVGTHDSDSQDYKIVTTGKKLDYETHEEVKITVRISDGVANPVTEEIEVDIKDVNEAPILSLEGQQNYSSEITVTNGKGSLADREQQEDTDATLWLNLTRMFLDEEDGESDRDELTFSDLKGLPDWIKPKYGGIDSWENIEDKNENVENFAWGTVNAPPDDDDYVLILEVDRTAATGKDGQDSVGEQSFSIKVTDSEGKSATHELKITVIDENINPAATPAGAGVTILENIREGQTVTVSFKEEVDPDFDGAGNEPVAVVYQVLSGTTVRKATLNENDGYQATQADVGSPLKGQVVYFELNNASETNAKSIIQSPDSAALNKSSENVTNAEDRGTAKFVFSTSVNDTLTVAATVTDEDTGIAGDDYKVAVSTLAYQWESSTTGTGNWTEISDPINSDVGTMASLNVIEALQGKYVRVKVTYDGEHGDGTRLQTITSDKIKVGDIDVQSIGAPTASALVLGKAAIGSTLSLPSAVAKTADIQWKAGGEDIPGATGRTLDVKAEWAGLEITAMVTERDSKGVKNIDLSEGITVEGSQPGNVAPTGKTGDDKVVFDLGAAPEKAGDLKDLSVDLDFSNVFSDFNKDELTFKFSSATNWGNLAEVTVGGALKVFLTQEDNTYGNSLLIVDTKDGKQDATVFVHTTRSTNHDGDPRDGKGNIVDLSFTAEDVEHATDPTAIGLRIDVKGSLLSSNVTNIGIAENTKGAKNGTTVATINVQDQNEVDHDYGTYIFEVYVNGVKAGTDDSPFMAVKATKADGSEADLKLKEGASLDYEKLFGKELKIIAMDKNGTYKPLELKTTVSFITNDPDDDDPTAPTLNEKDVPGFKDNDTVDDNEVDDGDDGDDDGGTQPPPMDDMAAMISMLEDGIF